MMMMSVGTGVVVAKTGNQFMTAVIITENNFSKKTSYMKINDFNIHNL